MLINLPFSAVFHFFLPKLKKIPLSKKRLLGSMPFFQSLVHKCSLQCCMKSSRQQQLHLVLGRQLLSLKRKEKFASKLEIIAQQQQAFFSSNTTSTQHAFHQPTLYTSMPPLRAGRRCYCSSQIIGNPNNDLNAQRGDVWRKKETNPSSLPKWDKHFAEIICLFTYKK